MKNIFQELLEQGLTWQSHRGFWSFKSADRPGGKSLCRWNTVNFYEL